MGSITVFLEFGVRVFGVYQTVPPCLLHVLCSPALKELFVFYSFGVKLPLCCDECLSDSVINLPATHYTLVL